MQYPYFVNHTSATYRFFTKSFALLLLAGFILPTGLQATQMADFCMMEMSSSHHMPDSSHHHSEDAPQSKKQTSHGHQECDWGLICACSVDQAPLSEESWIPASTSAAVILRAHSFAHTFFFTNEPIRLDLQARIGQHDPPLYILYDTLLN